MFYIYISFGNTWNQAQPCKGGMVVDLNASQLAAQQCKKGPYIKAGSFEKKSPGINQCLRCVDSGKARARSRKMVPAI